MGKQTRHKEKSATTRDIIDLIIAVLAVGFICLGNQIRGVRHR
jgi:hypothetical protein